jgi:hypothetical protein
MLLRWLIPYGDDSPSMAQHRLGRRPWRPDGFAAFRNMCLMGVLRPWAQTPCEITDITALADDEPPWAKNNDPTQNRHCIPAFYLRRLLPCEMAGRRLGDISQPSFLIEAVFVIK